MNNASTNQEIAGIVNNLIQTLRDGQEGFRLAGAETETPELRHLFNTYSLARAEMAGDLQMLVRELGKEYEADASLTGALHRGWMNLRAALSSKDDHAILVECERGEDSAIGDFRSVLEGEKLPSNVREVVSRQFAFVKAAHDRVRTLRDSHVAA